MAQRDQSVKEYEMKIRMMVGTVNGHSDASTLATDSILGKCKVCLGPPPISSSRILPRKVSQTPI